MAAQVDVFSLPNYRLSGSQHEWLWLFAVMVAGKRAEQTRDKLNAFLLDAPYGTPFDSVRTLMVKHDLDGALRRHRVGQYGRIGRALACTVTLLGKPVQDCTVEELEGVSGVGPKTARFYYMMTHRGARVAALDTHILKFLRDCGHDAPRSTPPAGPKYAALERAFLDECDRRGRRDVAAFDLELWTSYRNQ